MGVWICIRTSESETSWSYIRLTTNIGQAEGGSGSWEPSLAGGLPGTLPDSMLSTEPGTVRAVQGCTRGGYTPSMYTHWYRGP